MAFDGAEADKANYEKFKSDADNCGGCENVFKSLTLVYYHCKGVDQMLSIAIVKPNIATIILDELNTVEAVDIVALVSYMFPESVLLEDWNINVDNRQPGVFMARVAQIKICERYGSLGAAGFRVPAGGRCRRVLRRKASAVRPDANTLATPQKESAITLGYVEAKPEDSMSNPELGYVDLVHLGTFRRKPHAQEV
ncbi:hypothetical protein INT43_004904 [Umbelopsis isabellina]|uniref:Uncharacterized protein n=1 Tax=Mortierella isabellina TaxID=91625 RepID=A0A8H7PEA6_MORIS|nr:hypothetical protein INT43_004904 [Umbelopsis isabellina]